MHCTRLHLPGWALALLCLAISAALYSPVLGLGFLGDDFVVAQRAGVEGDLDQGGFFRPLSDLSILLGHQLHGAQAPAHRLFNVLVHGLCAYLLLVLLRALAPEHRRGAALAALLFLAYPYHGEGVIWLVGRGASMATAFTLLALLALIPGRSMRTALATSSGAWLLALLSYESALLFPLLALPMLRHRQATRRQLLQFMTAWGGTLLAYMGMRVHFIGAVANDYGTTLLTQRPADVLLNIPKAMGRLFLPPDPEPGSQLLKFLALLAVLAVATVLLVRAMRREEQVRHAMATLTIMLGIAMMMPVLGGVSTQTSESDRFLYMPSAFLCGLIALAAGRSAGRLLPALTLVLLVLQGYLLHRTQTTWAEASAQASRILSGLPAPHGDGKNYVVHLPDEHRGAYIFRHGFREALLLSGQDAERIIAIGLLARRDLEAGPDTLVAQHLEDGLVLEPGVQVRPARHGQRWLVAGGDSVLMSDADRVFHWDRHELRPLWP